MMKRFLKIVLVTLTLWVAADGQTAVTSCPQISIVSSRSFLFPKQKTSIKAEVAGLLPQNAHFIWGISSGSIGSENTNSQAFVQVEKGHQGREVTVFLKIENLPAPCIDTFSESFSVATLPTVCPIDEFSKLDPNDIKARIDNLYVQINSNSSEGLIVARISEKGSKSQKLRGIRYILDAVRFRNYDIKRLSFLITETKDTSNFVFWAFREGGDLPDDIEKTNLIKGEDLVKNISKALPKRGCGCAPQPK